MYEIGRLTRLDLGYQGESDTRVIEIDVSSWLERFPEATIVIQVLRPDGKKYLRSSKPVDGVMAWVIDKDEVSVPGYGMAQIAAINLDTGAEYRSRRVETIIKESMQEFLEDLEPGDPMNNWVNVVVEAAVSAEESMEAAKRSEQNAAESEKEAKTSETASKQSESSAAGSAESAAKSAENAATSATEAAQSADRAVMAAGNLGWFDVEVNDDGHLIYTRTENVDAVDFVMDEGRLVVVYG